MISEEYLLDFCKTIILFLDKTKNELDYLVIVTNHFRLSAKGLGAVEVEGDGVLRLLHNVKSILAKSTVDLEKQTSLEDLISLLELEVLKNISILLNKKSLRAIKNYFIRYFSLSYIEYMCRKDLDI